jgi:hypothetical protein
MPKFSNISTVRLATCDDRLQAICNELIKIADFIVLCGHRDKKEQEEAFENGNTRVHFPNSRHNSYPSEAVDLVPYWQDEPHVRWGSKLEYEKYKSINESFEDFYTYEKAVIDSFDSLAKKFLDVASSLKIKIEWGGNCFKTLVDRPHFQLKRE